MHKISSRSGIFRFRTFRFRAFFCPWRSGFFGLLISVCALLVWLLTAAPSQAHWADMAAAEIVVGKTEVQMTLTYPTGLTSFADDDQDGHLSAAEVNAHAVQLQTFLGQQIRLTNSENQPGLLTVKPLQQGALPPTVQAAPSSHSSVQLIYAWTAPVQGLKIDYHLFLPNVFTASCLATILQNHQLQTFVFTPKQPSLALSPGLVGATNGQLWLGIAGALVWGALHSLTPGHGKTIVGAYLVGTRATPKHAIFLALTSTVTHTLGVFALGFVTLFASRYILPEQLYPWLSLFSGFLVASIGFNLFLDRRRRSRSTEAQSHNHNHDHEHSHLDHHTHDRVHYQVAHSVRSSGEPSHVHALLVDRDHSHSHSEPHSHSELHSHSHTHLPPEGAMTWKNLLGMGISGGLVPCPAALVLLLSAIAMGNVGLGLILVLAFSLGLAGVLTGLGLSLVYTKQLFQRLPSHIRPIRMLPTLSAIGIMLIGFGISTHAVLQMLG
jgi:nickel/cobalt transporter (NicO) family protein